LLGLFFAFVKNSQKIVVLNKNPKKILVVFASDGPAGWPNLQENLIKNLSIKKKS
jgi:hypothetical protein